MKDYFSTQASLYAKFRPNYPQELFSFILEHTKEKELLLDGATGNGQVAIRLSPHFKKIIAIDISSKQLEHAGKKENIIYQVAKIEETELKDQSVNLITIGQALHWFDFNLFHNEAKRILKPNGAIAVWGYELLNINSKIDEIILELYDGVLNTYWTPERKYIEEQYTSIPFPYYNIQKRTFYSEYYWTVEQLLGYLSTWSSVNRYMKKNKENPLDLISDRLKKEWGTNKRKVTFPIFFKMGFMMEN